MHGFRQSRMREDGLHELRLGRLQRPRHGIALDQLGHLGPDHMRAQQLARFLVKDGLDQVIQRWGGYQGPTAGQRFMELYSPATDNADDYFRFQTGNAIKFRIDSTDALCIKSDSNMQYSAVRDIFLK